MDKQEKQPCRNQAQAKIHEHQKETDKTRVKRRGKEVGYDFKISVIDQINNGQISANYTS